MKILLLNDNPVVTKLVTLSAQKTDDEVEAAHNVEEVPAGEYDLLIIDDAQYDEDSYEELQNKINFKKSLFVCSRENKGKGNFSETIKKPFLPTDMVELLINLKKNLDVVDNDDEISDEELFDGLELDGLDEIDDLDNESTLESESVLDDEDAQEVKELLEDEDEDLNFDYDLSLDLEDDADVDISTTPLVEDDEELDDLNFDETVEDIDLDDEVDLDLEALDLEDDLLAESEEIDENEELAEDVSETDNFEDSLESQIEDAVEELSQEDLDSEVDEDTLLEIANNEISSNEIDSFANLNSKDLKAALGEEVDESDESDVETEDVSTEVPTEKSSENRGVESLKALLTALENENVVSAMKGAKITINISFED